MKKRIINLLPFFVGLIFLSSCSEVNHDNTIHYPKAEDTLRIDTTGIHFFVISDWGYSGSDNQRAVALEMARLSHTVGLNFILTCGDNFQVAGVTSVSDTLWRKNFEEIYTDPALNVAWFPALGNHDYLGNPQAQVDYSLVNPQWRMPARYYTFVVPFRGASIRFIVLDTPGLVADYELQDDLSQYNQLPQYRWLENVLQHSNETWKIVTGHYPVYSAGKHGDTPQLIKMLKPLFDRYKVDFYICGHDHHFEQARDSLYGTDYIITGTSGSPRTVGSTEHTLFALSRLGFSYFNVQRDSIQLHFITADDEVPFSYTRRK